MSCPSCGEMCRDLWHSHERYRCADWVPSEEDVTGRPSGRCAATEALDEIHEFQCGCDRPGHPAFCVAKPEGTFAAFARLSDRLDREPT